MAAFITNLWESVFTPGPTPTLIVATNVSFACLQLVLLSLLIATYSIHFVVLSFLSASLWAAINWFVKELAIAQARADAEAKRRAETSSAEEDSETEPETVIQPVDKSGSKEVEIVEKAKELKVRREVSGSKSEISTEDEWERVSENEKDK